MIPLLTALRRRLARFFRHHPALHRAVHPPYHALRRSIRRWRLHRYGAHLNTDPQAGNAVIREAILSGRPHGIGKIGSLEAEALSCFLRKTGYPDILREQLLTNVGLFPATPASIDAFCQAYLDAVPRIDILAAWGNPGEGEILRHVPAARSLVHITALEPWYFAEPWSGALAGKRVVVLHPFATSIETQYLRRDEIWRAAGVLPSFHLRTVRMPLSPALAQSPYDTWQDQLHAVISQIEAAPYDVVLVGAGGISLLVAAHAAARGKVGFHLGGLTQILFGILGRRWEKSELLMKHRNHAWTRPAGDEAPAAAIKVEQGCYW